MWSGLQKGVQLGIISNLIINSSISPQMKHGKRIRVEVRKKRRKAMSQKAGKKCEEDVGE